MTTEGAWSLGVRAVIAADRDSQARDVAVRLSRAHPRWWVHWGGWSREYWAFPLFNAPRGTYFSDPDPSGLAARMRETELAAVRRA